MPAQSVIRELLTAHAKDAPRSWLGRLFGVRPLGPESTPWYWGALGELEVGRLLSELGPEWITLHAVPVGRGASDIDHVVIGPGGVFTLNTKRHAGLPVWTANTTLLVSGIRQRHIPNAIYEARRASKLLSAAVGRPIHVDGAVVIVGAKSLTVKEKHPAIAVLTPGQLQKWLTHRPPVFTANQVGIITAAAVRPETWHRSPQDPGDASRMAAEFAQLRRAINQARRRRIGWAFGIAATVLSTLSGILPALLLGVVASYP